MRLRAGSPLTSQGPAQRDAVRVASTARLPLPRDARELPLLFREHFERAVAGAAPDGPAASMLSGGLDSGAVVCLESRDFARRARRDSLITCSVLADPPSNQETPYVRAVQAGGNLRLS